MSVIDEKEFETLREEMDAFDQEREKVIKESRDLLKTSKQAIYSLQRDDTTTAKAQLVKAEELKKAIEAHIGDNLQLRTGGFSNAVEEYVEARTFHDFLDNGVVTSFSKLNVTPEEYLGGLADLTGELTRKAVVAATARDAQRVEQIHQALTVIYGQFVQFDFRNGELRRKYDSIKYNVQKVERVKYDLSMSQRDSKEHDSKEQ